MAKTNFHDLIDDGLPVLIDFYADWCGPCKALMPVIQEVKEELGDQVRIIKINIDKNEELAQQLNVRSIPTLMIYNKGEIQWRHTGGQSKQALVGKLKEYLD